MPSEFDHPIRKGAMLRRLHEEERVEVLVEVVARFEQLDDGHLEYELTDPTRTGSYRYRAEDVNDVFEDTGLTNEAVKPIVDDRIQSLYQELHTEHGEHSWSEARDSDTGETIEWCMHCRLRCEEVSTSI